MIKGHVISVFAMNFTYSLVTAVFRANQEYYKMM